MHRQRVILYLKKLTIKDTRFLATSEAGIFLRFIYDGSDWIYSSVNEIEPRGKIVMFSGTISDNFDETVGSAAGIGINEWLGWAICNGNNGTPNLSSQFIVGYSTSDSDYNAIGKSAGSKTHTLTVDEMPAHNHTVTDPTHNHQMTGIGTPSITFAVDTGTDYIVRAAADPFATGNTLTGITIDDAGGGDPHENRPPYYTLAFVMKL